MSRGAGEFGVAVLAAALGLLVRFLLAPVLGSTTPYITFFPAIVASAAYGGRKAGLVTTVLAALSTIYFILPPQNALVLDKTEDVLGLVIFIFVGATLSWVYESLRLSKESERLGRLRSQQTLASIGDAVISTDAQGRIQFMNPLAEKLTGWTEQEGQGQPLDSVFRIVDDLTGERKISPLEQVLREGVAVSLSDGTALVARDGTRRPIEDSCAPIRSGTKGIEGAVLVFHDTSERRTAERERDRFFAVGVDLLAIVSLNGQLTKVNPAWRELLGWDDEELTSRPWLDFVHPDDRARTLAEAQSIAGGTPIENRWQTKDGRWRWINWRAKVYREEQVVYVAGTDVTERRQGEEAIRQSNRLLELLAASANDLLKLQEPKEFVQRLFERLEHCCGFEVCFCHWSDEQEGKLRLALCSGVPDDSRTQFDELKYGECLYGAAARDRSFVQAEDIQDSSDPATALVRSIGVQACCCYPLIAGDKLLGTLGFGTRSRTHFAEEDIELMQAVSGQVAVALERLLMVQELKSQNAQLEKVNRDLEEFAYVASHDMQEPLRMVNIYTELLIRRVVEKTDETAREYSRYVHSGVQRMSELIRDLLSYSRTAHADREVRPTDLLEPLADTLAILKSRIAEAGAVIAVPSKMPLVLADKAHCSQLFQNLIANSIKYRRPEVQLHIEIEAAKQDGFVCVTVKDNGIGFEPQHADRIFGLFKRLHSTQYPGTGIGLAIAKRIVERHGGRIWAEGHSGGGAVFSFTLPSAGSD